MPRLVWPIWRTRCRGLCPDWFDRLEGLGAGAYACSLVWPTWRIRCKGLCLQFCLTGKVDWGWGNALLWSGKLKWPGRPIIVQLEWLRGANWPVLMGTIRPSWPRPSLVWPRLPMPSLVWPRWPMPRLVWPSWPMPSLVWPAWKSIAWLDQPCMSSESYFLHWNLSLSI